MGETAKPISGVRRKKTTARRYCRAPGVAWRGEGKEWVEAVLLDSSGERCDGGGRGGGERRRL